MVVGTHSNPQVHVDKFNPPAAEALSLLLTTPPIQSVCRSLCLPACLPGCVIMRTFLHIISLSGTCAQNILLVVWFGLVWYHSLQGDLFEIHLYSLSLSASSHTEKESFLLVVVWYHFSHILNDWYTFIMLDHHNHDDRHVLLGSSSIHLQQ